MVTNPLYILYGSATGNAEHIAKDLCATYETLLKNPDADTFFDGVVCGALDEWKKKCQKQWDEEPPLGSKKHAILIVTSTTGNGDAPENASRFVRYIKRKTTPQDAFSRCAFSVLGLGDTNYDQFCANAKIVDRKLADLGGTRALDLILADEGTGNLEEDVERWLGQCLQVITRACRVKDDGATVCATVTTKDNAEEEKKADVADAPVPPVATAAEAPSIQLLRALLERDDKKPLWEVDFSTLPGMTSSLSSCALITNDEDLKCRTRSDSISTASSGFYYNLGRPFESSILEARYLTATSTDAASEASRFSLGARQDVLDRYFPLGNNPRNGKRVMELTLSLPEDYTLEYQPGDSLGLVVSNPPAAVDFVLNMLQQYHAIHRTHMVSIDEDQPITVEEAIRDKIDLCSPLTNKRTLHALSQFATDPVEACALQLLCSKTAEGEKLFCEYIDQQRLSVVDILREFPSTQSISVECLLSNLPRIAPRYYSVSSSPIEHKRVSVTIAFSIVDYFTTSLVANGKEFGRRRVHGVATSFMEAVSAELLSGTGSTTTEAPTLRIFPKPTADFRMPAQLSVPLILIGPGTGIAPFMGFLAHRKALLYDQSQSVVEGTWRGCVDLEENDVPADFIGSVDLFFGCRHEDHDWLYRKEMKVLKDAGVITRLHTAFSRDEACKTYVQDLMHPTECSSRLVELVLDKGAAIYICGDGNKMAKNVQATLVDLLASSGRLSDGHDEAQSLLAQLKKDNRLLLDIWSKHPL